MNIATAFVVAGVSVVALTASPVLAGLGGVPATLGAQSYNHPPRLLPAPGAGYTEIINTLESGTIVNQYVTEAGTVFAVSWSGPFLPDLEALLGANFNPFLSNQSRHPRNARSHVRLRLPGLVLVSGGRMGAFAGQAWVPALLPVGFDPGVIQ